MSSNAPSISTSTSAPADPATLPPLPKDHLDHPEQWATGGEPATEKQKGFIKVLQGKHGDLVPPSGGVDVDSLGKSEASEVIDTLKKGEAVVPTGTTGEDEKEATDGKNTTKGKGDKGTTASSDTPSADSDKAKESSSPASKKRKTRHESTSTGAAVAGDPTVASGDEADDESATPKASSPHIQHGGESQPSGAIGDDERETDESHQSKKAKVDKKTPPGDGLETPADEQIITPSLPSHPRVPSQTHPDDAHSTIPGDGEHLDHPENWTTGDEPATEKQKAFVAVLEKKSGVNVGNKDGLGKSEASEVIDELKGKTK